MTEVSYDTRTGHCVVKSDTGRLIAQLVDMGGACAVYTEGDMSPDEATKLGHALIAWSAWRRRVIPTIDHYERTKRIADVCGLPHTDPLVATALRAAPDVSSPPGERA